MLDVSDSEPSVRPWNAAEERDDAVALGVIPGQLDRRLDRLGARVARRTCFAPVDGAMRVDLLGQPHLRLVIEVGARHVQELLRLLDDRGDDLGMRSGRSS